MTDEERAERMKTYDGRYGDAEPAGDPDNDDAYAPGTAKDIERLSENLRAAGHATPAPRRLPHGIT
ncbi:hypothetical protein [Fodinicola acaciae]|uniref:hypothetical protein n=1 Tax=Fodinicola acaciae TaxID=2681555 RepID=UPI0013D3DD1D|nr:hypothetical protein [Fodinicola acaciae]